MLRGNYPPGYLGWELMDGFALSESKAVSEMNFNGLNGELDIEYLLRFDIRLKDSAHPNGLRCNVNNQKGKDAARGRYIHLSGENDKTGFCRLYGTVHEGIALGGYGEKHTHRYMRGDLHIESNSDYGLFKIYNTDFLYGFVDKNVQKEENIWGKGHIRPTINVVNSLTLDTEVQEKIIYGTAQLYRLKIG